MALLQVGQADLAQELLARAVTKNNEKTTEEEGRPAPDFCRRIELD